MNGVKGLILKEIYLRRKSFLSGLSILVLMFILAASFCLSFDYGNMKNNENLDRDTSTVMLAYVVAAMGIFLFSMNGETLTNDIKCKWNIFEQTLPLSAQKLAAVKIGLSWGANLLGTVISMALSAVIFKLSHHKFTLAAMANITAIALIAFVLMTVMNFLLLKFKNPQKAALSFTGVVVLLYGLFIVWIRQRVSVFDVIIDSAESSNDTDTIKQLEAITIEEFLEPVIELRDRLFPFFIFIFAAIAVIGYFLFLTQYKRREK